MIGLDTLHHSLEQISFFVVVLVILLNYFLERVWMSLSSVNSDLWKKNLFIGEED